MRLQGSIVTAALIGMISSSAFAQEASTSFQVEQFEPLPSQRTSVLNLATGDVLKHMTPSAGLFLHFVDDPIQVTLNGEPVARLVDDQLKGEFSAALGLFDWMEIGLILPVALYQTGDASPAYDLAEGIGSFALGDLRVVPKVRLLDREWLGGVGASLSIPVYLPTGDDSSFNSDGSVRAEPRLAVDYKHDSGFQFVTNVGYQIRPERVARNFVSGNSVKWGAGLVVPLGTPSVALMADIFGSVAMPDGRDINTGDLVDNSKGRPMEALGGLRFELPANLLAQVGGGAGLTDSVGSPDFRVFAGLTWSPVGPDDTDGDGILDPDDACPTEPEDKDGWEDLDGCPDTDNDGDLILDVDDSCPDEAEDVDTFEDENGCPDPDNDADGVLDGDDKCPLVAGPAENTGCPWGDTDGDGLMDNNDECPNDAEDKDGFEDEDGCPDIDNDKDGFLDGDDKCPNEPETINGKDDDDGCPDEGESKVRVTAEKIEILEKVFFDTNKDSIKTRSFDILNQVASVIKANPQITLIQVEGHTDDRGNDAPNLELSQRRADSVLRYLVARGLDTNRMRAVGFGETKPIADNKTSKGRDTNRRVEFNIVETSAESNVKVKE
jgi:outer membrane protein OmpA-like peptidoglycan-associated protein